MIQTLQETEKVREVRKVCQQQNAREQQVKLPSTLSLRRNKPCFERFHPPSWACS